MLSNFPQFLPHPLFQPTQTPNKPHTLFRRGPFRLRSGRQTHSHSSLLYLSRAMGRTTSLATCFFVGTFVLTFVVAFVSGTGYYSDGGDNKLLLILVDGCRWDYPDQEGLPGFRKLAENGVRAPYVTPIFPSNSYPNWYTITTGERCIVCFHVSFLKVQRIFFLVHPHRYI